MPKHPKRNSSWYRHFNHENKKLLDTIFNKEKVDCGESNHNNVNEVDPVKHPNFGLSASTSTSTTASINASTTASTTASTSDENLNHPNTSYSVFNNENSSDEQVISDEEMLMFSSGNECQAESGEDSHFENFPENNFSVADKLKNWAVVNKITHSAMSGLLDILSSSGIDIFENLPKDTRSFLKTIRHTNTVTVSPGEYYHVGIQKSLEYLYSNLKMFPKGSLIEIGVCTDGLPLCKSSLSQFYPVLGINKSLETKNVFLIGLYHGYEKPKDFNQLLSMFVCESIKLIENGITVFNKKYSFKISSFHFDAVAKASVLFIKGHSGYSSCTKCTQEGEYIKDRVCFPDLAFTKRTHKDFVDQTDPDHHTGHTHLLKIPGINIIDDIPLDYMHLVMLGVVKKIISGIWCNGPPPNKLSSHQIQMISENLLGLVPYVPMEFARKPRGLKEVKMWKATEFRQFLLYTGPLVLKDILPKNIYQLFMTLSVAINLLLTENISNDLISYAESLLLFFIKNVKEIYGSHLLTHNFHNLLHLCDDVRKFGSLDNFSNFAFENFLQHLLKLVRKPEKPLQQVIRRYHEMHVNQLQNSNTSLKDKEYVLKNEHFGGSLILDCVGPEYKAVYFKNYYLGSNPKDSCCILNDGSVFQIHNIAFSTSLGKDVIIGHQYKDKCDFFSYPCPSSNLNIYKVDRPTDPIYVPISEIKCKAIHFPYESQFVIFPLIHSTTC
ncbi:unnamed protein product [Callosobruchus maculatus]|uniref:DUF4218 domain-containing protein n=1 Tax=Callosobruchus maculatus TaxID=64391 RepID=A0A653DBB9_CALMS|nr:unnamed protein product [Callosobruchus maculatus]